MKILVVNGPNLNLLGKREKSFYGELTLTDIEVKIKTEYPDITFEFFQSNLEGEIVNQIQNAPDYFDGIIINPAAYSHTSVAIRDALEICKLPKVEVHLSNIADREEFRKTSITAARCDGYLSGFKEFSYLGGIYILQNLIKQR
ncbi:MAG: type II 3-dehydroquinate dehydratase [Rhodothermaceae bacterium]